MNFHIFLKENRNLKMHGADCKKLKTFVEKELFYEAMKSIKKKLPKEIKLEMKKNYILIITERKTKTKFNIFLYVLKSNLKEKKFKDFLAFETKFEIITNNNETNKKLEKEYKNKNQMARVFKINLNADLKLKKIFQMENYDKFEKLLVERFSLLNFEPLEDFFE